MRGDGSEGARLAVRVAIWLLLAAVVFMSASIITYEQYIATGNPKWIWFFVGGTMLTIGLGGQAAAELRKADDD